jgi:hypothetical protein
MQWASAYGSTDIGKDFGSGKIGPIAVQALSMVAEIGSAVHVLNRDLQDAFKSVDRRKVNTLHPVGLISANHQAVFGTLVLYDASKGSFTIRLPIGNRDDTGRDVVLKNTSSSTNPVTVTPSRTTVDGGPSVSLTTAMASTRFHFDGQQWWTV